MTALTVASFDFAALIPSVVFLVLALVVPFLFYHIANGFIKQLEKHMPQWLNILAKSYLNPMTWSIRQTLVFGALVLLPIVQSHAKISAVLATISTLLDIYFLGLGAWRSAPMCRLLLRSAQNHLDLETNQTMARFFENLFRALVVAFAGIAMLDTLGVPVSGLLTGAEANQITKEPFVGGPVHTVQSDRRHRTGAGASLRHRGLHCAGRYGGNGGRYRVPLHQVPHVGQCGDLH